MAGTTSEPADREGEGHRDVERFDVSVRLVHWSTAAFVGVCALTALALSVAPVAAFVGRRDLVRTVHTFSGLLIPVPLAVGWFGPRSARLRADVRALDRFDAGDVRWLRAYGRDRWLPSGKFHPGQKLNAAIMAGALVLLFATGIVLRWFDPFPLVVRRGATFVHDWTAFLLAVDLAAHVFMALRDREALRAMATGRASRSWAARVHPRWDV